MSMIDVVRADMVAAMKAKEKEKEIIIQIILYIENVLVQY